MATRQKGVRQFSGQFGALLQRFLMRGLLLAVSVCACSARGAKVASETPQSIIVVCDDNYPPYCFRDANGRVRGILPDQWKLWEKETGVQVDFRAMEWNMAQRVMQEGQADVIDTMFITDDRLRDYDFAPAYATLKVPVYVHRSLGGIKDISSLKGFLIGVKAGDAVIDFLATHGISSVKRYPSYGALIQAAKNEEIKVFSVDEPPAAYYLYKQGVAAEFYEAFILYTGQFHRAVRKGDTGMRHLLQEGFEAIPHRDLRAIERRWKGSPVLFWAMLRPWWNWIMAGFAAILFLGLSNLYLHYRIRQKTSELRQVLADLQQSLVAKEESEKALRENHALILQFIRRSPVYTYITEVTSDACRVLMASNNFKQMIGLTGKQMEGKTLSQLFPPEFAAKFAAADRAVIEQDMVLTTERFLDGRTYTDITFPIRVGARRLAAGYSIDITERKQADAERIRAIEEKAALEARLVHVQKLEAIGRLAGGVAHDFNNMLQAILGYTEMALDQVVPGRTLYNDLLEIKKAAQRSAVLTQQLQTFARKDVVTPKPLNLNSAIANILAMLHQLIDADISLEWKPAQTLGKVLLDAGQFDQVVANLVLNARDAVGTSGHIVLETEDVTVTADEPNKLKDIIPGAYIRFSVRDDGCGMSPEIVEHVFEPFFTTKPIGSGTGMGLAAVYGIVKQACGYITVESEPGKGTLLQIYLPRANDVDMSAEPDVAVEIPLDPPRAIGHKTILLVDDETSILAVTGRTLAQLGYHVLVASSPSKALALFDVHKNQIDLLVTDVVMPGMSGPEMVKRMLELQPRLRYLFISGNTSRLIADQGLVEDTHRCILKPYSSNALAQKIREALA